MVRPDNGELLSIFRLFFDSSPQETKIISTSRGVNDFRETILATWDSGERYVLKLADNDFTFPAKIETWQQCAKSYRALGYYCPAILCSKKHDFPIVHYKDHTCVAWAEEYATYATAEARGGENTAFPMAQRREYMLDAFVMTAKIAAMQLDFTAYPSGYCLFERFAPSDASDEVLDNARQWKAYADTLPAAFQKQIARIWQRWTENRRQLQQIYPRLPTSVFQADLNPTNILLDENGKFAGILDFNLCGRDVFLNYLFREIYWIADVDEEIAYLLSVLQKVSTVYRFSALEIEAAPLLYRCLKPLWFTKLEKLKAAGADAQAIQDSLNETESLQTRPINFVHVMRKVAPRSWGD